MLRSKIKGMLIGGAIGDALGLAVESWSPEKIREIHPEGISRYVAPIGHKWYDPEKMPLGSTSDDTQLTVATVRGLIAGKKVGAVSFNEQMDAIASAHVEAMKESTVGWGKTTQESVRRLANGVHWSKSGISNIPHRGTGNGVVMKCSPLAACYDCYEIADEGLVCFSAMTHYSQMSAIACIIHFDAIRYCLHENSDFSSEFFQRFTWIHPKRLERVIHLEKNNDNLISRFNSLFDLDRPIDLMTHKDLVEVFGNGSCYVYDSLPFSYFWFLRNPDSFQSILDVINAGGDTDTNAKIVGELLGALHGFEFFDCPENRWAIDGLQGHEELIKLADEFCDAFGL